MFRFLMLCALILMAWMFVDVRWQPDVHVLALRVRSPEEIRDLALERAHNLGREWVRTWNEGDRAPGAVSSPSPRSSTDLDRLTPEDQRQLDRVLRSKLQR